MLRNLRARACARALASSAALGAPSARLKSQESSRPTVHEVENSSSCGKARALGLS